MITTIKDRLRASAPLLVGGIVGSVMAVALLGGHGPLDDLWANDVVALVDEDCAWSRQLVDHTRGMVSTGDLATAPLILLPVTKPDGKIARELCAAVSKRAASLKWRIRTMLLPEDVICRMIVDFARSRANEQSDRAVPAFFRGGVSVGAGFTSGNLEALGLPVPDSLRS